MPPALSPNPAQRWLIILWSPPRRPRVFTCRFLVGRGLDAVALADHDAIVQCIRPSCWGRSIIAGVDGNKTVTGSDARRRPEEGPPWVEVPRGCLLPDVLFSRIGRLRIPQVTGPAQRVDRQVLPRRGTVSEIVQVTGLQRNWIGKLVEGVERD